MEETLNALIKRIEAATISDGDKEHLFLMLRYALQAAVTPVLVKHLPKQQMQSFMQNLSSVSIDGYITFVCNAIQTEGVLEEIEQSMTDVLREIGIVLTESGV